MRASFNILNRSARIFSLHVPRSSIISPPRATPVKFEVNGASMLLCCFVGHHASSLSTCFFASARWASVQSG
jgi:hypothetical protein